MMLPIGLVFAGYSIASWGYVLVKGYNITLREWFTPLHPWSGALDANGCVPQGSIFPKAGKGGPCGGKSGGTDPALKQIQQREQGISQNQGRVNPGGVSGRF